MKLKFPVMYSGCPLVAVSNSVDFLRLSPLLLSRCLLLWNSLGSPSGHLPCSFISAHTPNRAVDTEGSASGQWTPHKLF